MTNLQRQQVEIIHQAILKLAEFGFISEAYREDVMINFAAAALAQAKNAVAAFDSIEEVVATETVETEAELSRPHHRAGRAVPARDERHPAAERSHRSNPGSVAMTNQEMAEWVRAWIQKQDLWQPLGVYQDRLPDAILLEYES